MTWDTLADGEVLREDGVQTSATYIGRGQGIVEQWVDLHPIFEVCAQEQGFEEGWWRRRPWQRQEAMEEVLRA